MFIDSAEISLKAGDGGNGAISFHREKYVVITSYSIHYTKLYDQIF